MIFNSSVADRFWAKVDRRSDGECWPWTDRLNSDGYGRISVNGRPEKAHRLALILSGSPVPFTGASALHRCDNRCCVNPAHLYWGSQLENMRDRAKRLRHPMAKLTPEIVKEARNSPLSDRQLAAKHGVLRERIRDARLGRTWSHVK